MERKHDTVGSGPALLYRAVQDQIKQYILDQQLGPGDALPPETHFARTLGISRSSVREAVKALESLGILETRPGKGLFVRGFSLDPILDNLAYGILFDRSSVIDLLRVREYLEAGLVEDAMVALSPIQHEKLRQLIDRMRQRSEQHQDISGEDQAFHQIIAEATGNNLLILLLDVFWTVFGRLRRQSVEVDPGLATTWLNHQRILDAIENNDGVAARRAIIGHFADLHRRLGVINLIPGKQPRMRLGSEAENRV
ncbi:MAG TPA: FadR/GntR family transcriptional regulator [Chloroflexota bacterium]|nr:FadR/GntR family transcriptional regulator [Chloroflexota bacterium]